MTEPTSCCRAAGGYCDRCDLLVGLDGLHVIAVDRDDGGGLTVDGGVRAGADGVSGRVVSSPTPMAGVEVRLVDAPALGRPVRIVWRKRRWVCPEPACPVGTFVEQDEDVARAAGAADGPGVPVGDRADPSRARVGATGSAAGSAPTWRTVWDVDPAAARGGRRGRVPVRGREHPGRG